jgi:hypothetical protein
MTQIVMMRGHSELTARLEQERAFDRAHGVDTSGTIPLQALDISSPNKGSGVRYEASDPNQFRELIDALPISFSRYTFIDIGAGKGRAMLLASEFPFRRIVGVEFSADLVRLARSNLERFESAHQRCRNFEVIHADAVDFQPPNEPLVVYFYNPFVREVMRQVLANVRSSAMRSGCPVYVVVTGSDALVVELEASGFQRARDGDRELNAFTLPVTPTRGRRPPSM